MDSNTESKYIELETNTENVQYDTIVFCRGKEFKVHKAALIASSPYFNNLLSEKSSSDNEVEKYYLDSFDPESLKQVFDFIYMCPLQFNDVKIQSLMQTARSLQMTELYKNCISYLQSQLNPFNFVEIWELSDLFADQELDSAVEQYCVENYFRLRNTKTFLSLSQQRLTKVLQNNRLDSHGEQLLETIMEWVRLGQPEKQQEMTELLYILRSDLASKHYLHRLQRDENLLKDVPNLKKLLLTVLEARRTKQSVNNHNNYILNSHNFSINPPLIVAFIETEKNQTVVQLMQLNGEMMNKNQRLSPFEMKHAGTVVCNDRIYCCGGRGFRTSAPFLTNFCCYDPIIDEVTSLPFMTTPRAQLALAVHEGNIYAIGGYNSLGELAEAEKYSIEEETWSIVTPMNVARKGIACLSVSGKLYGVGGRKNMETVNTVEYYTTTSNQWTQVNSLLYPRTNCKLTSINNKFFVCGGFWSIQELIKSNVGNIQVYDTENGCWNIETCLKTTSLITSVFAWDEKLYLFSASGYVMVYFVSENLVRRVRNVLIPNGLVRCAFPITNANDAKGLKRLFTLESLSSMSSLNHNSNCDLFNVEETRL